MPYRLRYSFNVDYVPPGTGTTQPDNLTPGGLIAGGAQTKNFIAAGGGQMAAGAGTGGAINATDVTNLTNAAAADMAAQLNANLGQLAAFISGGP